MTLVDSKVLKYKHKCLMTGGNKIKKQISNIQKNYKDNSMKQYIEFKSLYKKLRGGSNQSQCDKDKSIFEDTCSGKKLMSKFFKIDFPDHLNPF